MSSLKRQRRERPSDSEILATVSGRGRHAPGSDAHSVEETAHHSGVGRSTIYKAINPDPAKRDGLPFLASFTVGRRRLIRTSTRQAWLAALEAAQKS
jgi:hypothetical protein